MICVVIKSILSITRFPPPQFPNLPSLFVCSFVCLFVYLLFIYVRLRSLKTMYALIRNIMDYHECTFKKDVNKQ